MSPDDSGAGPGAGDGAGTDAGLEGKEAGTEDRGAAPNEEKSPPGTPPEKSKVGRGSGASLDESWSILDCTSAGVRFCEDEYVCE